MTELWPRTLPPGAGRRLLTRLSVVTGAPWIQPCYTSSSLLTQVSSTSMSSRISGRSTAGLRIGSTSSWVSLSYVYLARFLYHVIASLFLRPPRFFRWSNSTDAGKGIWSVENAMAGLSSLSLAALTRPTEEKGLGWSREEVEVLNAGVRREMTNTSVHMYAPM